MLENVLRTTIEKFQLNINMLYFLSNAEPHGKYTSMSSEPTSYRLPGLFGFANPVFCSSFGANSSSIVSALISEGSEASSYSTKSISAFQSQYLLSQRLALFSMVTYRSTYPLRNLQSRLLLCVLQYARSR